MSSLAVLIPVKSAEVKSRLSTILSKAERSKLESLLLAGVLGALEGAGLLPVTRVVSSDSKVLRLAAAAGARTVLEPRDEGVNSAVLTGVGASGRPSKVLVLPSDLPLLRSSEVRHVIALSRRMQVVIAPSAAFDGTNALVFSPRLGPELSYDDDSFWNHLRGSARKGLSVAVASDTGLTFDLDSPADLRRLARSGAATAAASFAWRVTR